MLNRVLRFGVDNGGTAMRHLVMLISLILVLGGALFNGSSGIQAQEDDLSSQDHILVGTWVIDPDVNETSRIPSVAAFHDDGTYTEVVGVEGGEESQLGAWAPTGERTADLTIVFILPLEEGVEGTVLSRLSLEVSEDGNSFTGQYTIELLGFGLPGDFGPITASGSRVEVEAMGTPVGTGEEFFDQFEAEPVATPEV
jgi:hypothetical protein